MMKHLTKTLLSFTFFICLGGALVLLAPKLLGSSQQATALASTAELPVNAGATILHESLVPALAVARRSDEPPQPGPGVESHQLDIAGKTRQWWSFDGAIAGKAAPVVLLLHGSGRTGRDMIQPWQEIASRAGLVLVAPDSTDPNGWTMASDGLPFLNAVLAAAAQSFPVDRNRVLMFGHSAGANFALMLAATPPDGVQAVAVHAGQVSPVAEPASALPLRIYVGDADHLFPLDAVRASAEALAAAGHPTDLVVIPGHDHWFYDAAPAIAADAWTWFASK